MSLTGSEVEPRVNPSPLILQQPPKGLITQYVGLKTTTLDLKACSLSLLYFVFRE